MFDDEDREAAIAVFVTITLAILAAGFATTIAIATVLAVAGAPGKPMPALPANVVIVVFEADTAELPADALTRIAPLLRSARSTSNASFVITSSGDSGIAALRAAAVEKLLQHAGVPRERIATLAPQPAAPVNEVAIVLR